MNDNLDSELRELRKQIADDLSYRRKGPNARRLMGFFNYRPLRRISIVGGVGLLVAITLIALISGGSSKRPAENPTSAKKPRLSQLEEKIMLLEGIEDKIINLEQQEKELHQSLVEMGRAGRSLRREVDELSQVVDKLQKRMVSGAAKTEDARPYQRNLDPPAKRLSHVEIPLTIRRMPFSLSERRYHVVLPGECLSLIAESHGISVDELCKLNHITPNRVIHPGQKLLVALGNHQ